MVGAFVPALDGMPSALPQMLAALDASITEPMQIVVAGQRGQPETEKLLSVIRRRYIPNKVVLLADGGEGQHWLTQHIEALRAIGRVRENRPVTCAAISPAIYPSRSRNSWRGFWRAFEGQNLRSQEVKKSCVQ